MNIIQENNWVITTKKGKGKWPLFFGNLEHAIPIYAGGYTCNIYPLHVSLYGIFLLNGALAFLTNLKKRGGVILETWQHSHPEKMKYNIQG